MKLSELAGWLARINTSIVETAQRCSRSVESLCCITPFLLIMVIKYRLLTSAVAYGLKHFPLWSQIVVALPEKSKFSI